jgi:hypothetical protein
MVPDATGTLGPPPVDRQNLPHRACYILERGQWKATCRICGWQISGAKRQVAANLFRSHIRDMRAVRPSDAASGPGEDAGGQGGSRR